MRTWWVRPEVGPRQSGSGPGWPGGPEPDPQPQVNPRRLQDGSRRPHDGPGCPSLAPTRPQDGPRTAQGVQNVPCSALGRRTDLNVVQQLPPWEKIAPRVQGPRRPPGGSLGVVALSSRPRAALKGILGFRDALRPSQANLGRGPGAAREEGVGQRPARDLTRLWVKCPANRGRRGRPYPLRVGCPGLGRWS